MIRRIAQSCRNRLTTFPLDHVVLVCCCRHYMSISVMQTSANALDRKRKKSPEIQERPGNSPVLASAKATESAGPTSTSPQIRRKKMSKLEQKAANKNKTMSKISTGGTGVVPTSFAYIAVIQNGGNGFGKSVFLRCSNTAYLFNCSEGTQRLLGDNDVPVNKLTNIFLTGSSWDKSGGLPGLMLSLQAARVPEFTVHGPRNVQNVIDTIRPYSDMRQTIAMKSCPHDAQPMFDDQVISVQSIPIFGTNKADVELENEPNQPKTDVATQNEINELSQKDLLPGLKLKSSVAEPNGEALETDSHVSVAFLVTIKPKLPKIDAAACMQLKVPFGPLIGQLQDGKSVTLKDGRVIRPEQVIKDVRQDPETFLVVDCPSTDFLSPLTNNAQLNQLKQNSVSLVVHFSDESAFDSDEYQTWMQSFGPNTKHLVVNGRAPCVPHVEKIIWHQAMLHQVHPLVYPKLHYSKLEDQQPCTSSTVMFAQPKLRFWVRSRHGARFDQTGMHNEDWNTPDQPAESGNALSQTFAMEHAPSDGILEPSTTSQGKRPEICDYAKIQNATCVLDQDDKRTPSEEAVAFCKHMHETDFPSDYTGVQYPMIRMLGTCSAVPSRYRNVSGIWVDVNEQSSVLLDCGEGTYNQLFHLLGAEECDRALARLKFMFISHMHQDHYLGIFTMLKERRKAMHRLGLPYMPVYMMASALIFNICKLYDQLIEPMGNYAHRIHTKYTNMDTLQKAAESADLERIEHVKVLHPLMAYGIVVVTKTGVKLVYSGDTRPCDALIQAGQNADLLIHEATFEAGMNADALAKRHCTMSEAIDVAQRMGAKSTLLTHFSPRYVRVPPLPDDLPSNISVASDFMCVTAGQFNKIPLLVPALQRMFDVDLGMLKIETQRREEKEKREILEQQQMDAVVKRDEQNVEAK